MSKTSRSYGMWDSPISPRSLAEDKKLEAARFDSDGRTLVWLEGRSGRGVLVAQAVGNDAPRDLTTDLDVRAEVGYGGGDFGVHGGSVYFAEHKTGRLWRQPLAAGPARPITPRFGQAAAPTVSPDGRWVAYVHNDEDLDKIAVVDAQGGWPQVLAEGRDFYMQPRWRPDGRQLAWIAWDHPNMPWDGTTLYLADVIDCDGRPPRLGEPRAVAGGPDTAIFQPEFTPDGRTLLYVSDESGWGRIAAQNLATGERRWLTPDGAEHAEPGWNQDMRTYAVLADGRTLVAARNARGLQQLVRIDLATGEQSLIAETEQYAEAVQVAGSAVGQRVVAIAGSPTLPRRVVVYDLATGQSRVAARSSGESVPAAALAKAETVSWPTAGGQTAHGLYYPPASERFESSGRPPLIVLVHGGPTSQVRAGWRPEAQFFATRGWGVLFVNYRGSTGYGRPYMLQLRGSWGLCDVEDSVSGARWLAESGRVDPARKVIMGGSAGGFTVLHAMVTQPEAFTAGVCLYGVADQFHLAAKTHKFESRYLDTILGPLPQTAAIYRERSPAFHAERICRPLAVFQGDIDRVVPKAQSDGIVAALKRTGTPHEYHLYEGEGHGWRKRETIEHFYRTVDEFLQKHVLFS